MSLEGIYIHVKTGWEGSEVFNTSAKKINICNKVFRFCSGFRYRVIYFLVPQNVKHAILSLIDAASKRDIFEQQVVEEKTLKRIFECKRMYGAMGMKLRN